MSLSRDEEEASLFHRMWRSGLKGTCAALIKFHLSRLSEDLPVDMADELLREGGEERAGRERLDRRAHHNRGLTSFLSRSVSHDPAHSAGLFGKRLTQEGVALVAQLVEYLHGHTQELGLFRMSGSSTRMEELKGQLNAGETVAFGGFSPHDAACVLKTFLLELPEPLLSRRHLPFYRRELCVWPQPDQVGPEDMAKREFNKVNLLRILFLILPAENRAVLALLLPLLHKQAEGPSRMSADTLATIFVPAFFGLDDAASHQTFSDSAGPQARLISLMIRTQKSLFRAPPGLRQHLAEEFQRRRTAAVLKRRESEKEGDGPELVADVGLCDRRQSQLDKATINTDTQTAQLYAHIASMPDNHREKRKLIAEIQKSQREGLGLTPTRLERKKKERKALRPRQDESTLGASSLGKGLGTPGTPSGTPGTLRRRPIRSVQDLLDEEAEREREDGSLPAESRLGPPLASSSFMDMSRSTEDLLLDDQMAQLLDGLHLPSSKDDQDELPDLTDLHDPHTPAKPPAGLTTYSPANALNASVYVTRL